MGGWGGLLLLCLGSLLTSPARAAEIGDIHITVAEPIPPAIQTRIAGLLEDTLAAVLGENGTLTLDALKAHPAAVAEQLMTGMNFELEDRGYHFTSLRLEIDEPITAYGEIGLVGAGVEGLRLDLAAPGAPEFWLERHRATLAEVDRAVRESLEPLLIGLPIAPRNPEWARNQIRLELEALDNFAQAFPDFAVTTELTLAQQAVLLITLTPQTAVFEVLRVEARSDSLLTASLDTVEELILGQADLIVGQPIALVMAEQQALTAEFERIASGSTTARQFRVSAPRVVLWFPEERPDEARCVIGMESDLYHFRAEAFIDWGNDDLPAEFQAHAGYRLDAFELFTVLNAPAKDPEARLDLGLAIYTGQFFAGGAWDTSEGAIKYFGAWEPSPLIRFSAEIYADEDEGQTQVGVLYQPTQQLGVGAFTDTDDLFWLRTSFRL